MGLVYKAYHAALERTGAVKVMQAISPDVDTVARFRHEEQVTGHQVGPAADRYSLATIAYEMLTGVIPFDGEALMELLYAQVHREPPSASVRNPSLSPQVDAVIARGLAKDPAARWESATAFVEALAGALASEPGPALARTMVMGPPAASTVPLGGTAVAERVAPSPQPETVAVAYPSPNGHDSARPAKRSLRLNRRMVLGIAAVLVLLLVLGLCQVALASTTIAVNPSRVGPRDTVNVTATRLPAGQLGESRPSTPPSPSPSPAPNPCPTSSQAASLTTSPATVIAGVTTVTATGQNFTPYKSVMVYYYLGSTLKKTWTLTVSCAGTFSVSFQPAPLDVGTAKVAANDSAGRNASKTFTIVA